MNRRRLMSGSFAVVASLIVIAIAVVVNMIVSTVPTEYTRFDTTGMGLYDLSADTEELIKNVDKDVTLYLVARDGQENSIIEEFLKRYTKLNSKISIQIVDPELSPTFATPNGTVHTLSEMYENSVIVSSELRDYVADYYSIFTTEYSDEELQYYYTYGVTPTGTTYFEGEQAITSAIDNVTTEDIPIIYTVTDHQETEFGDTMKKYIKLDNYELKTLSLATGEGGVPDDAGCVIINAPTVDITADELEMLKAYVDGGGKLIVACGSSETDYTNLNALAAYYGMNIQEGTAIEGDANYIYRTMFGGAYSDIIAHVNSSDPIGSECSDYMIFMPMSKPIEIAEQLPEGVEVTSLLYTSDSGRIVAADGQTFTYEGTVCIAAHATVNEEGEVLWLGSSDALNEESDLYGGNTKLLLSSLLEFCDKVSSVSIAGKVMDTDMLAVPTGSANGWTILMVVAVPLAIIVTGIVVWTIRRKK